MKSRILLAIARLLVALPLLSLEWPVAHADSTPLPARRPPAAMQHVRPEIPAH